MISSKNNKQRSNLDVSSSHIQTKSKLLTGRQIDRQTDRQIYLRLDNLTDQILGIDRVALFNQEPGSLAAVRGRDDHFLQIGQYLSHACSRVKD